MRLNGHERAATCRACATGILRSRRSRVKPATLGSSIVLEAESLHPGRGAASNYSPNRKVGVQLRVIWEIIVSGNSGAKLWVDLAQACPEGFEDRLGKVALRRFERPRA